jgi:hypothetical protein
MLLLTKEIRKKLPPLYATEKDPDPIIRVKFFNPCGAGTWYATEFDGTDLFFGLCDIQEKELGYFSLSELSTIRLRFGLKIERDLHFGEKPLSKVYPERYPLRPEAAQEPGTIGGEIESLLCGGSHG